MSTWTSIYVKSNNETEVIDKIKQLTKIESSKVSEYPTDIRETYLLNEKEPYYFAIGSLPNNWVQIDHNSFNKLEKWGTAISKDFDTSVIIIMGQTTADVYYFALYEKGNKRREIEVCYSEDFDTVDFGEKFPFENDPIGKRSEYDGEAYYMFDIDSIIEYCEHFDLKMDADADLKTWTVLKGNKTGKGVAEFISENKLTLRSNRITNSTKPWWKFW